MKIVLIRHGITLTNTKNIFSPDDEPLSEDAYPGLDLLKETLKNYPFKKVYASPLVRTVQTAEYLGLKNLRFDLRLKEYEFGIFKGLTFSQAEEKYPEAAWAWINSQAEVAPPDGETARKHFARVSAFLEEILSKGEDCIIVTHYGTVTMALAWALDNFFMRNKFAPKNASISVLKIENGFKTIEAVNI